MAQQEIHCPHCNQLLTIEADWIGMELECPICKKNFTIPAPAPAPLPVLTPVTKNVQPEGKFTFVCPSCNGEVELENHLRGTQYECQFCFDEHIAEPTVTSTPGLMQINAEETFLFICPECDTAAELPESILGKEYECLNCCETTIAQAAEERKCPKCGEMIKIKATICKHCKSKITPLIPQKKINNTINRNTNISMPQNLSPIAPGMNVITPASAANKNWTSLVLWNLLLPGLGQVYLGHTQKGIICLVLFLPVLLVVGLLSGIPFIARLVFVMAYACIVSESFGTLAAMQMGQVIEKNKWLPRSVRNNLTKTLPPEIKKKQIISICVILPALLLGATGLGILVWIWILSQNA